MITNFFRIKIPFETFQIQRRPYADEELAALRQQHNRDASFFVTVTLFTFLRVKVGALN